MRVERYAKILIMHEMQQSKNINCWQYARKRREKEVRKLVFQLRSLPKIPFSLGLRILFKNQLKPRTQGVKSHSNHKHVWSIDQSSLGVFC
jgi:hypothetical protein